MIGIPNDTDEETCGCFKTNCGKWAHCNNFNGYYSIAKYNSCHQYHFELCEPNFCKYGPK